MAYTLRADAVVTLAEAKQELGIAASDATSDDRVTGLINAATSAIATYTGTRFSDDGSQPSRVFDVIGTGYGALANLRPTPALTVTGCVLDPATAPTALTENQDYRLLPVGKPWGIIEQVELYAYPFSAPPIWYGPHTLQVTGTWGYPSVPDDVRRAALVAVGLWSKHDQTTYAAEYADQSTPLDQDATGGLPWGALRLLKPYRRLVG